MSSAFAQTLRPGTLAMVVLSSVLALLVHARPSVAQERHAVLVFGAAGGQKYAADHARWRTSLVEALKVRLGFRPDRILVLGEGDLPDRRSTRENIARVFSDLSRTAAPDDLVFVLLVGHGTVDAVSAKFNLPGPDMDDAAWAALLRRVPGRLVFVNAASGSFPFLRRLSGPNRILITATDSPAQRFYTVFPDRLVATLADPAADLDRNGRLSLWEVFSGTSAAVRTHYEQRGQLATERPVLDDDGDGSGTEAGERGLDGVLARTTYLDADPVTPESDPALAELVVRQRRLEREAEDHKLRKNSMPQEEWSAEFERIMIELARVSRAIRSRS